MSEEPAAAGSATALVASNAGTPAAATGAADPGSNGGAADLFAGLETGTRDAIGKKGFKSVADLATGWLNAESLIGRSIVVPGDDAKPEDVDKFLQKATAKYVPKDANGYEFKLPEGLPADFAYDKDRATAFKSWAHANGLTPKQAQGLHDAVVKADAETWGKLSAEAKKVQEAATAQSVAATETLAKAFGGPKDSPAFKQGIDMAIRAIEGLDKLPGVTGILKAFEGAGLVVDDGKGAKIVLDPTIAIALSHVGKMLFKEDSLETGGSAAMGDNPFAGDGNMTLQMQMIRTDPSKARRMIAAIGKQPMDFQWDGKDVPALPR